MQLTARHRIIMLAILILISAIPITNLAQGKKIYLNDELFVTNDSLKATCYGYSNQLSNGMFEVTAYLTGTSTLFLVGHYADSSLIKLEGPFTLYHSNGLKKTAGLYKNDKGDGIWVNWNNYGYITDSLFLADGGPVWQYTYKYYPSRALVEEYYQHIDSNIIGKKLYYEDGKLRLSERTVRGNGEAYYFRSNGDTERYVKYIRNKAVIDKTYKPKEYDAAAITQKLSETIKRGINSPAKGPEYPGGPVAYIQFFERNLNISQQVIQEINYAEPVDYSFDLDEKGIIRNVIIHNYINAELKRAFERVLYSMPRWNMNGVKSYHFRHSIRLI